ncbi:MAG TPA: hypothetical protein VJ768_10330, partial [Anaerolineales bacterium]|nr:hypothetical protein [Anaerolineales bacterium]
NVETCRQGRVSSPPPRRSEQKILQRLQAIFLARKISFTVCNKYFREAGEVFDGTDHGSARCNSIG